MTRPVRCQALLLTFSAAWSSVVLAQTPAELWNEYVAAPYTHPNIPNNSYAGYRQGEEALPQVSGPIFDVTEAAYGADDSGADDSTEAIAAAIAAAGKAGGGVVLLPAGTYRIDGIVHLNQSGVVLRGAGVGATILDFRNSLADAVMPSGSGSSVWSWSGGLVWISPDDTFESDGDLVMIPGFQGYERWRGAEEITDVVGTASRGDFSVQVAEAGGLQAGDMVLLKFAQPESSGDSDSFMRHVYGDEDTVEDFDWAGADWLKASHVDTNDFPMRVAAVDGTTVTFSQPLRTDIEPQWDVRLTTLGTHIHESGVEALTIKTDAPLSAASHNKYDGHNGIYLNRGYDLWVRDVEIDNSENGIITAAVKNVTVTDVTITGAAPQHHSFATRVQTMDTLFQDFRIDGPKEVFHGINSEGLSAGNVFSRGYMAEGTFDSHRYLPFDLIRTEIELANDDPSKPGGSGDAGPFAGARVVHWNIDIFGTNRGSKQGIWVYHPSQFPWGAMVGIRGADPMPTDPTAPDWEQFAVPDSGAMNTIVAGDGEEPAIVNLYQAQLELRLGDAVPTGAGGSGSGGTAAGAGASGGDAVGAGAGAGLGGAGFGDAADAGDGCSCRTAPGSRSGLPGTVLWAVGLVVAAAAGARRRKTFHPRRVRL